MKEIIFLNRAYNDMDIQASLIHAFAATGKYAVRVIGFPCDGYTGAPEDHEAAPWLRNNCRVSFENVLNMPETPVWIRMLYKAERYCKKLKISAQEKGNALQKIYKILHVLLLKILSAYFKNSHSWLEKVTSAWSPAAVIIDEVVFQKGRSQIIDRVLPEYVRRGVRIYAVQTGQHIYYDPYPTGTGRSVLNGLKVTRFMVPSSLDVDIISKLFPAESPVALGNLRMDKDWIQTLHQKILVPPYYDLAKDLNKLPDGKVKIAFMLSKLNYGVEVENLKATIRAVGHCKGVAVAIKPHTRGMKFDFMNKGEIGNAIDASSIPSALLTEWADLVVVTGSSVVFHAMVTGKQSGILKYCQPLDTVFDQGVFCHAFRNLDELLNAVTGMLDNAHPTNADRDKAARTWVRENVHGGRDDGRVAETCLQVIEKDLVEANS